jgi:hypothetical protein
MSFRDMAVDPFGLACIGNQPSLGEMVASGLPFEQVERLTGELLPSTTVSSQITRPVPRVESHDPQSGEGGGSKRFAAG